MTIWPELSRKSKNKRKLNFITKRSTCTVQVLQTFLPRKLLNPLSRRVSETGDTQEYI